MKIPATVKIGVFTYELRFVEKIVEEDGTGDNFGRITYSQSLIEIKAGMSNQTTLEVLMHECIHGIEVHAGNQPQLNESSVDALAYGMVGLLVDNPWLNTLIQREFKQGAH